MEHSVAAVLHFHCAKRNRLEALTLFAMLVTLKSFNFLVSHDGTLRK